MRQFIGCMALALLVSLGFSAEALAATKYWIGSSGGSFTSDSNWSTSSGGANNATKPGSSDVAVFDGGDVDNCDMGSASITVGAIDIQSGYSGTLTLTSGTLTIMGTSGSDGFKKAGGTLTHNSGTLKIRDGTGGRHVYVDADGTTLYNLTIDSADNWTVDFRAGAVTAAGALVFSGGIFVNGTIKAQADVTVDASLGYESVNSDATLTFDGGANQNFDVNDTADVLEGTLKINKSGGTVTLLDALDTAGSAAIIQVSNGTFSTGSYNVGATTGDAPKTITIDGGTWTQGSGQIFQRDVSGTAFTCSSGTFTGSSGNISINGDLIISGCSFTSTSGTLEVNDDFTVSSGSFTHNSGTVELGNGSTGQETLVDADGNTITFYNLTIDKPSNWDVEIDAVPSTTGVLVTNNFIRTAGRLNVGEVEIRGNIDIENGDDDMGSSKMKLSGGNTQTFDATAAEGEFNGDLAINKSGGQVNLASALTINAANQDLIIQEGTFDLNGYTLTVNGTSGQLDVESGGNLQLKGDETITANAGNPELQSGSTVTYDGTTGPYTVKNYAYHHLAFNGSGGVFNLGADESIAGDLTLTAGTFDISSYNMTVTGTFSNSGTFRLQGGETTVSMTMDTDSGTIEYDGSGTYTSLKMGNTYYNLTFNGSGSWKPSGTVDVNGGFTITNGTFNTDGQNMTVAGSWSNSGVFTHGSATVTLDGSSQTISGTSTFYNLTKVVSSAATLTLPASVTTTIANTMRLEGASGQVLSLRSSSDGTAYSLDPQGATRTVSYLNVKDATNIHASKIDCFTGCTDATGNTNWLFAAPTIQFSAASSSGGEGTTPASIVIALSTATGTTNVSVDYAVTSGTATGGGTDYTLASGTATITAGNTTASLSASIVNDSLDEDDENFVVTLSNPVVTSISGNTTHTYTITDDDASPSVTLSVNNATIAENGGVATFTATLSAASGRTVTVDLSASGTGTGSGTDYTLSGTSITITAGNTTGTRTVTGVNDALDEDDETAIIDIASVTNGTESGTQQQTTTLTDDDASPSVTLSVNNATIAEDGGVATFTATLSAASGRTVTVDLSASGTGTGSGTDYTLSGTSITITAGNTTGTRTVTGVNDALDEDDETAIIDIASVTNGTESGTQQQTTTLTDDDASPSVTLSVNNATIAEDGGVATFTATLSAASGRTVTVDLSASGTGTGSGTDYTLSGTSITITAGNTTGTRTVTGVNDALDEDDETAIIDIASVTNGTESGTQQQTTTLTDDDASPSVTLGVNNATIAEDGGVATFTATLSAASGKTVTVDLAASGTGTGSGTDYTLSGTSITITAGNITGTRTVTGVNDALDEDDETAIIDIASVTNGTESGTQQQTTTLTDDDASPSVTLSVNNATIAEDGGVATFTATLSAASGRTVTVDLSASGTGTGSGTDYTLSGTSIAITAGNTTGTRTVTAVQDTLDEDDETAIIDISAVTNGTESGTQQQTTTITDDDAAPTVTLSVDSGTIAEDGSVSTVTATLSGASGKTVTVNLATSGTGTGSGTDYTLSGTSITINAGSTTGTRTVTSVADSLDESNETAVVDVDSVTHGTEATPQRVTITITDNDTAGVTITQSGGTTNATEGGSTDSYTVVLTSQPTSNVTVTINPGTQVSVGEVTTLTFTSGNWSSVQTVTTTAVNDDVAESNHTGSVTHSGASSDSGYNGISIASVTVNITDNDSAGVSVTESSGSTAVTEGGATDTYTVVLTSEPTSNVSISIAVAEDVSSSASTLTFTSANWDTAQTITVTGVDDDLAEGNHTGAITHSSASSDSNYNALSVNGITASVTDNDSVGVTVNHTGGTTVLSEAGTTDTYKVVLNSEPFSDVTITINPGAQITLSATTLTFTAANWDSEQTLTVTAVNDNLAEGAHNATLTHTAASADSGYNALSINNLVASISDNETASITVTQSSGSTSVSEAGTTDTYTIVLTSQPTASVTIAMTAGAQITVAPTSFTFSTTNWNTAQTATVSAAADFIDEDTVTDTITHAVTTTDTDYTVATAASVSVSVADDDTAGVTITESNSTTAVTEGSTTDTYTVILTSQPTANVTVSTTTGTQLTTATTPLTFTSANWNTAQTVTVTAVDDSDIEANPHTGTIAHTLTTNDAKYAALTALTSITASITENDEAAGEQTVDSGLGSGNSGDSGESTGTDSGSTTGDTNGETQGQAENDVCSTSTCVTPTEVAGVLIAARGSKAVYLVRDVDHESRTVNRLDLPNDTTVYTTDDTLPTVLFHDSDIVIADAAYDNDKGRVLMLPVTTSGQTLDMTSVESNLPSGAMVADGTQAGDLFGDDVEIGDYDCDDTDEVWVLSSGTSYGTVTVLDANLDLVYLVLGAAAEPITSITSAGLGASCGNDMIASVSAASNASLNDTRFAIAPNSNVVASSTQFYGLVASESASTVIDFATDSPDYVVSTGVSVSHMVSGDINGDGIGDLILASAENCELMVILGGADIGSSTTTLSPDYTSTCDEDTDLASLAVGDVNADGFDDILVGFPEAASGSGRIFVMTGSTSVSNSSVSFASASTITGSSTSGSVGQWIVINDSDGDGTNDIHTNNGDTDTYSFEAAGLVDTEDSTDTSTGSNGLNGFSAGGAGCSLNKAQSTGNAVWINVLGLVLFLILVRRWTLRLR